MQMAEYRAARIVINSLESIVKHVPFLLSNYAAEIRCIFYLLNFIMNLVFRIHCLFHFRFLHGTLESSPRHRY